MALRSLAVKLNALPLRVPGYNAFTAKPKDDPWDKIVSEFENSSKYGSFEEFSRAIESMIEKQLKATREESTKKIWGYRSLSLLIVGALGTIGYFRTSL